MKGLQPELSFKVAFCCIPALYGHSVVPARKIERKRAREGDYGGKGVKERLLVINSNRK